MDRRRLLFGIGLFSLLGALALPFAARLDFRLFCAVLFIWGGVTGSLYAVGLAHLCARCQGAELASANAAYIMLYSVGMLAGPPILGIGLDLTPQGLFFGIALLFGLYLGIALARIGRPSLT
jgi:predicted MFS family arabinose efflux permease